MDEMKNNQIEEICEQIGVRFDNLHAFNCAIAQLKDKLQISMVDHFNHDDLTLNPVTFTATAELSKIADPESDLFKTVKSILEKTERFRDNAAEADTLFAKLREYNADPQLIQKMALQWSDYDHKDSWKIGSSGSCGTEVCSLYYMGDNDTPGIVIDIETRLSFIGLSVRVDE
jgi:hypothetical protein